MGSMVKNAPCPDLKQALLIYRKTVSAGERTDLNQRQEMLFGDAQTTGVRHQQKSGQGRTGDECQNQRWITCHFANATHGLNFGMCHNNSSGLNTCKSQASGSCSRDLFRRFVDLTLVTSHVLLFLAGEKAFDPSLLLFAI